MAMALFFACLCALSVVSLLVASYRRNRPWAIVAKTTASLSFVATGFFALPLDTTFGKLMMAGFLLSLVGDLFLLGVDRKNFVRGVAAFFAAQVAYSAAFVSHGLSLTTTVGALIIGLFMTGLLVIHFWPHVPQKFKPVAGAYAAAITGMVVLAAGTSVANTNVWIFIGALTFYVSDISVTRNAFTGHTFTNLLWGLPLYYAAQLIFALLS
jgi:uncharacterized membrane protein YhhN